LDALAVDELFAVIGLQQQPIASGDFQFAGFAHVERGGGTVAGMKSTSVPSGRRTRKPFSRTWL
jgi:hypothetical protein